MPVNVIPVRIKILVFLNGKYHGSYKNLTEEAAKKLEWGFKDSQFKIRREVMGNVH
jgi:hypothetical protein